MLLRDSFTIGLYVYNFLLSKNRIYQQSKILWNQNINFKTDYDGYSAALGTQRKKTETFIFNKNIASYLSFATKP